MCGIVGFLKCGSEQELRDATSAIAHRGPDNTTIKWFASDNTGLGHVRLSIIDLSESANQPMYDETTGNWIVYNGEIYNYGEIKTELQKHGYKFKTNSDTEVILKSYEKWGVESFTKFNGMFAFCIYNEQSKKAILVRDRLGIKPLYYVETKQGLIFASEIKAILKSTEYVRRPDLSALHTPVHYQISPYTGFKDIYKLPAGHCLHFTNITGASVVRYWQLSMSEVDMEDSSAIEKLDHLINDAVDLNMVADTPIGVMLSGGLDSSIIAALMQKKTNRQLNSFTIKFEKKDLKQQGNVDDSFYAKKMAEKFGFAHNELTIAPKVSDLLPKLVYHLDEPLADPAAINTFLISEAARKKGIKVLLTGMGADEVFGGYRVYQACLKAESYQKYFPSGIQKLIYSFIRNLPENNSRRNFKYIRWIKRFVEIGSYNQFERQLLAKNSALNSRDFREYFMDAGALEQSTFYNTQHKLYNEIKGAYLNKMCFLDTTYYMADHNLMYCDKSMMAAGVEGRPTLLDHRIVELLFTMKPDLKIRNGTQKYVLKKVAEKYLPQDIIYRPKAPFSAPMRGWLKNELKEMVNDLLSEESLKKRGFYNHVFVKKLIKDNSEGKRDNSQLIWRLMVNEIWFRTFFNN